MISLYDPEDLQVRVDVRLENAGRVRVGQTVEVTTEAEPGTTYRGTVIRVEPRADLKKNTIQAKIRLEDPGPGLHPEMICRARFLEAAAEEESAPAAAVPTVPATAVVGEDGAPHVFVVRDGRAVRVEVRLGEERSGRVEIRAGLAEGDRVVVAPPPGLVDGSAVEEEVR